MPLLATDIDRTLIPNGDLPDPGTLPLFFRVVRDAGLKLAYASGRNLPLLEEAISKYDLEIPDYFIASVGSELFIRKGESLVVHEGWHAYQRERNPAWNRESIEEAIIARLPEVSLQGDEVQNEYKISFYADNEEAEYCSIIASMLDEQGVSGECISSFDPQKNLWLIDVLPRSATKVTALEFVRSECALTKEEVIYAGDSGNDVLPLTFGYKSIVVANARAEIKEMVQAKYPTDGAGLYIAEGGSGGSGNYTSGILEGLVAFAVIEEGETSEV